MPGKLLETSGSYRATLAYVPGRPDNAFQPIATPCARGKVVHTKLVIAYLARG